ncbi:MAG: YceI family protein [Deltaproteobacteria bacterium]|nr:YceI family protein [Deltaproteobacteria bacterium]
MSTRTHRPPEARCEINTFKEGLLSRVAHDLAIAVERFEVTIGPEGELEASFAADSLKTLHALKKGAPAPKALSAKDLRTIDASIRDEVLGSGRMPTITYRGRVEEAGETARIDGTLSLHGVERRLRLEARRAGDRWEAEVELNQPDYGIRPFTALMGSLKIKPEVRIKISLPA